MDTIKYRGCTATIAPDDSPPNPFTDWDCEPPLLVYSDESVTSYGAPETLYDFARLLPDSVWQRGNRVRLIQEHTSLTLREFAQERRRIGDVEAFVEALISQVGEKPSGWSYAKAWFKVACGLLDLAGIPYHFAESKDYHPSLVLSIATPAWVQLVGAPPKSLVEQCKDAHELYSQWAWGEVYGVSEITDPEGREINDVSCGGFFGSDHEKSGLMEHVRYAIDHHLESQSKEAAELDAALCAFA